LNINCINEKRMRRGTGICSLPLILVQKYAIMKNSDKRQGGSIFGQKFWFNAVGKKGRISVDVL